MISKRVMILTPMKYSMVKYLKLRSRETTIKDY